VTVFMKIVDASTNATINSKTVTYKLQPGVFTNFTWFSINASKGMNIRAFANITQYQNDTDTRNNAMWSNIVFLKPYVDFSTFVTVKIVRQRIPYALLPEDEIEIDVRTYIPINTTSIPARLSVALSTRDLMSMKFVPKKNISDMVSASMPGYIWRNFTVTLPWSDKIRLLVNVTHPWEDNYENNGINYTIDLGALVMLSKVTVSGIAGNIKAGSTFSITINITTNIPKALDRKGSITVYDNTTNLLAGQSLLTLEPNATVSIKAVAPKNPALLSAQAYTQLIESPVTQHTATVIFAGYADYVINNYYVFNYYVWSDQWIGILLVLFIVIFVVMAVVWALRKTLFHTIEEEAEKRMKFVKKKYSGSKFVHKVEDEEKEKHFVHAVEKPKKEEKKFVRLKQTIEEVKKFVKKKDGSSSGNT
ncbi:MAG: hypothetical protein ACP5M7_08585, partial [Thermoproteota archaeon]